MSIVGSDYDKLKRFNLAELYTCQIPGDLKVKAVSQIDTKPHGVTTDEKR